MRVSLVTVKHTGTHFTANHLKLMGFEQAFIAPNGRTFHNTPSRDFYYHLHVGEREHFFDIIGEDDVMVTTLRDPRKVFYSLGRRRAYLSEQAEEYVLRNFGLWKTFVEKHDPFILQIDADSVAGQVVALGKIVGCDDYSYTEVDRNHRYVHDFHPMIPKSIIKLAYSLGYRL
jgi:hypothetical protein